MPVALRLSDGEWHRLHPASPLLKGGLVLVAVLGYLLANARERFVELFVAQPGDYRSGDPIDLILSNGLLGYAIAVVFVVLVVLVGGFYLSWRMHTFRITAEVVEVRSGVLFRTNRKARLDRIQSINIVRPLLARLFGAARLEVNQAGHDANVRLDYLGSDAADDLRREILRLASGTRVAAVRAAGRPERAGALIDRRLEEFLAPELDPDAAEPASVVNLSTPRLIGSILLSSFSVVVILIAVGIIVGAVVAGGVALLALVGFVPYAIGVGGYYVRRFTKSLRYTIAGTPDGVRIGFGLFSVSNETLPPGRIHSVQISQPLLWRPAGWWEIRINRAGHSSTKGASGQHNTTILPVGDLGDVKRVLGLVLPDFVDETAILLAERGLTDRGGADDGFENSPRRAAWLRWFSWRRNGFAVTSTAVLLRKGAIWRSLTIVPHPRVQSVSVHQGPLLRRLRLAAVHVHTVSGPIVARLGAIDSGAALRLFVEEAESSIRSANIDTSHRWRAQETDLVDGGETGEPASAPAPELGGDRLGTRAVGMSASGTNDSNGTPFGGHSFSVDPRAGDPRAGGPRPGDPGARS